MNREEFEQLAAAQLYGEITVEEQKKLQAWLTEHPEDRQEMDELQAVMGCLNTLKTEPAHVEPLRLYDITGLPKKPTAWHKWITAAAACIAVIICVSQGVVIQIGSTRIAVGKTLEQPVTPVAAQAQYESIIPDLLQSVQTLQQTNDEMLAQQIRLETGLINLNNAQTELAMYNQKQFGQFAEEFVDVMDQKLRYLMPVSYIQTGYEPLDTNQETNQ